MIPKGQDWKTGICRELGVADPRVMWRRILDSVHDWKQLEQPFVAAVEQLIDFVTMSNGTPGDRLTLSRLRRAPR